MSLRDIAVTLVIVGSLPFCFMRPYIGVLVWTWILFMSPHRLTWGFAYDLPFCPDGGHSHSLLGLIITKDRRNISIGAEPVLLVAFWAVTALSTLWLGRIWTAFRKFSS